MLDEMGSCPSSVPPGRALARRPSLLLRNVGSFSPRNLAGIDRLGKSLMDDMTTEMTTRRHSPPYCNSSCSQLISFLLRGVAFLSRCFPFGGSPAVLSDGIQKDGGRKTNCANIVS